jgi:predicted RNA-binding protein with TRAM domain
LDRFSIIRLCSPCSVVKEGRYLFVKGVVEVSCHVLLYQFVLHRIFNNQIGHTTLSTSSSHLNYSSRRASSVHGTLVYHAAETNPTAITRTNDYPARGRFLVIYPIHSASMVEIPAELRTLFTQTIERRGDRYVLEIPAEEVSKGTVTPETVYRVALLPASSPATAADEPLVEQDEPTASSPPVTEGEHRTVTIEDLGAEGDGIAKVERGYVVIVPGGTPGEEVTVEITRVTQTVAFATRRTEPDGNDAERDNDLSTGAAVDEFL